MWLFRIFFFQVFYLFFLTLFSFVLLVDYFPLNNNGGLRNGYAHIKIPITEIFVHILVWSLIVEEGKEVNYSRNKIPFILNTFSFTSFNVIGMKNARSVLLVDRLYGNIFPKISGIFWTSLQSYVILVVLSLGSLSMNQHSSLRSELNQKICSQIEKTISSRILMCLMLFLWYIRVLHVFAAYKRLGPKLLMIFNTVGLIVFVYCQQINIHLLMYGDLYR